MRQSTDNHATSSADGDALRLRFRDAMASLPAAVNIVTTAGPAGCCGITATAVCSVSDAPPTLLFCVNGSSTTADAFQRNGTLCVNVLPAGSDELARHFAGMTGLPMAERFAAAAWDERAGQAPRLRSALASLAGRVTGTTRVGTHLVMFAEIDDIALRPDADAQVWFDRAFHRVARAARPVPA